MRRLDRILNYLALGIVVTFSALWGVFDVWIPTEADLPRVLGFLLGLMAAATFHTWTRYADLRRSTQQLNQEVNGAAVAARALTDATRNQITQRSFSDAFSEAFRIAPTLDHLRVYAVTTQIVQAHIYTLPFRVGKCEVLTYKPRPGSDSDLLATRIDLAIEEWRELLSRGQLQALQIRRYEEFPTQYIVIFDDKVALWGVYHHYPKEYTGTRASDPFIITGQQLGTRSLIAELIRWFDSKMAASADNATIPPVQER